MIAIVTDSSAYLTKREAIELGVKVVPITYYASERMYLETYADLNGDFVNLLNKGKCQTSQPGIGVFLSTFEELLRLGCDILCITISSRLSGTYSSASIAVKELGSDRIRVVDSLTTGGGLYFLVREAKRMADKKIPIEEIASALEKLREKIAIAFSVDDMTPLRKSGRLGIVRQSVGTILNRKPLLLCEGGSIVADGVARGRQDQMHKLVDKIPYQTRCAIVHYIGGIETAKRIADEIRRMRLSESVELRPLGPVLGIHLGTGVIGIAWMEK
jgi:DegV family protein with EDD domain